MDNFLVSVPPLEFQMGTAEVVEVILEDLGWGFWASICQTELLLLFTPQLSRP